MTRPFFIKRGLKVSLSAAKKHSLPLLLLTLTAFAGCGKKGPPLPPIITVPGAVKNFTIEGRGEGLLLSWKIPEGNRASLAGFKLHRQAEAQGCTSCPLKFPVYKDIDIDLPHGAKVEKGVLYLLDTEVERGYTYRYKVVPYSRSGYMGPFSKIVEASWSMPPQVPTGLQSEPGDRSVRISWSELHDPDIAGYRVYRTNKSQSYGKSPVNKKPVEAASYTDIGLENNRQYYYVVKAIVKEGSTFIEGPASSEVLAIPLDLIPPSPISGLRVVPSLNKANLIWDESDAKDILGYFIYRQEDKGIAMEKINTEPARTNHYIDDSVEPGKTYQYTVTAVDSSPQKNESSPSNTVNVSIPAL